MSASRPPTGNSDPGELARFGAAAHRWWDTEGEFKPLHAINPLRLGYIDGLAPLAGQTVLDVGCGGGLLAEAMAAHGASVTGIDLAGPALEVAHLHALQDPVLAARLEYRRIAVEELAAERPASYDTVTCMEMLEHVPDPASVVRACGALVRPGGDVFFSTLNRNPKAFLLGIVGAEYVLGLVPRGTHRYEKFIKPSELAAWCRAAGLEPAGTTGLRYNPLSGVFSLAPDTGVNYILHCRA